MWVLSPKTLQRTLLTAILSCCLPLTANGQTPSALHRYPGGLLRFDSDGQAKAIVLDVLKYHGIQKVDWEVAITDDSSETANAVARIIPPDRKRQIIFNQEFMRN